MARTPRSTAHGTPSRRRTRLCAAPAPLPAGERDALGRLPRRTRRRLDLANVLQRAQPRGRWSRRAATRRARSVRRFSLRRARRQVLWPRRAHGGPPAPRRPQRQRRARGAAMRARHSARHGGGRVRRAPRPRHCRGGERRLSRHSHRRFFRTQRWSRCSATLPSGGVGAGASTRRRCGCRRIPPAKNADGAAMRRTAPQDQGHQGRKCSASQPLDRDAVRFALNPPVRSERRSTSPKSSNRRAGSSASLTLTSCGRRRRSTRACAPRRSNSSPACRGRRLLDPREVQRWPVRPCPARGLGIVDLYLKHGGARRRLGGRCRRRAPRFEQRPWFDSILWALAERRSPRHEGGEVAEVRGPARPPMASPPHTSNSTPHPALLRSSSSISPSNVTASACLADGGAPRAQDAGPGPAAAAPRPAGEGGLEAKMTWRRERENRDARYGSPAVGRQVGRFLVRQY